MLPNFFLFNKRLPHEQKKAKNKKKGKSECKTVGKSINKQVTGRGKNGALGTQEVD